MPSLTQMNKKQLVEEAKKVGIRQDDFDRFKRKDMINFIRRFKEDAKLLVGQKSKKPTPTVGTVGCSELVKVKSTPKMGDENWTNYVLDLLRKDELQDGNPTLFGLRRIAQQLIGPIISSRTDVKQIPNPGNNFTATVVVSVLFKDHSSWYGAADVSKLNCMEEYAKHPTATAESRAEGRALRKALGINVHTVDEVGLDPVDTSENGPISSNQVSAIETMANKRLNISIPGLLCLFNIKDKTLNELTIKEGIRVLCKLQEFLNEPDNIPKEMKNE